MSSRKRPAEEELRDPRTAPNLRNAAATAGEDSSTASNVTAARGKHDYRKYWPTQSAGQGLVTRQVDLPANVPVQKRRPLSIRQNLKLEGKLPQKQNAFGQILQNEIKDSKPNITVIGHAPSQAQDEAYAVLRGMSKYLERPLDPDNPVTALDMNIEDVLEGEPVDNRTYRGVATSHRTVNNGGRLWWILSAIDDQGVVRYFGYQKQYDADETEAQAIAQALANILNHLPVRIPIETIAPTKKPGFPTGTPKWSQEFLIQAARRQLGTGTARCRIRALAPTLELATTDAAKSKKRSNESKRAKLKRAVEADAEPLTAESHEHEDEETQTESKEKSKVKPPARKKNPSAYHGGSDNAGSDEDSSEDDQSKTGRKQTQFIPRHFQLRVFPIDPETYKTFGLQHTIKVKHVKADQVPPVPDGSMLLSYDNGKTWEDKVVPDSNGVMQFRSQLEGMDQISAEALPKYIAMERLAHQITLKMHGKIMTREQAKQRILEITQQFGGEIKNSRVKRQLPAESIWSFDVHVLQPKTLLYPSRSSERQGCKVEKGIQLFTLDKSWFAPIVQVLEDTYRSTRDFDKSWADAARIAEAVAANIASGDRAPAWCDCAIGMNDQLAHPCSECMLAVICANRVTAPSGHLVCPDCIGKFATNAYTVAASGAILRLVKRNIKLLCKNEASKCGLDTKSQVFQENQKALIDSLKESLAPYSGLEWKSEFTSKVNRMPTEHSQWRLQPLHPSTDAFFPYAAYNGRWFVHCSGNVGLVEQPLNFLKHTQLPSILWLISENLKLQEGLRRGSAQSGKPIIPATLSVIEERVVKGSANLRTIRKKSAFTQAARIKRPFDQSTLQSDSEEWISGTLRKVDAGPWEKDQDRQYVNKSIQNASDISTWVVQDVQQLRNKVLYYLDYFGLTTADLPQNQGCFYFCSPSSMPPDWSWGKCFRVCVERFIRERDLCNRVGCTVDTPKTIYIFCIIVVCIIKCTVKPADLDQETFSEMKKRFEEFLLLPMVPDLRDALRFTLGHFDHEQTMWTGVHPTTLDFDFKANNMLLETASSNYLKQRYLFREYPLLKQMVRDVKLSKKLMDRDLKVKARRTPVDQNVEPLWLDGVDAGNLDEFAEDYVDSDEEDEEVER